MPTYKGSLASNPRLTQLTVGVLLGVRVGVDVDVFVGVRVGVAVGVSVNVGEGVNVDVSVGPCGNLFANRTELGRLILYVLGVEANRASTPTRPRPLRRSSRTSQ